MPDPIPLEMPPDDAGALAGLVRAIAAAADCLAAVDDRLLGAASSAPRWLGDDAAATAAQVGAVTALVRDISDALPPAIGRLDSHAELLLETRRQVAALLAEQREHFAVAWRRWGQVESLQSQVMTGGTEVRAIVEDVEAGEASRRRRHGAVLEELEDDAAATARVLADSCAVIGGRGTRGDANLVVAYLAAQLPGWGDLELARRGRALADELTGEANAEERTVAAEAAATFAGRAAFANALLGGLGEKGVGYLLGFLGTNTFGPDSSVARLLAAAFGAAVPSGGHDPVRRVLDANYVPADDRDGLADDAAAGLATVLAAGLSMPSGGVQTRTVAEWSKQLLLRERAQGSPVGRRWIEGAPELSDPTELVIGVLADRADPAVSAALLDDGHIWEALLSRVWGDAGAALGEVVTLAELAPGAAGDHAVRTGLRTVGAGLAADDPDDWTVNRETVAAIAPALGGAVAAHLAVAVDVLRAVGVAGLTGQGNRDILSGLGYLTLDRGAAAEIEQALHRWALVQPGSLTGTGPLDPLPAIAVPSAFVAVQQFAQRSRYALDGLQAREAAENRELGWNLTVGLIVQFVRGYGGVAAGVLEGYAAIALDADGTWENGVDRGLVFDREDAAAAALTNLPPAHAEHVRALTWQARAAFDRTAEALGERRPPESPPHHYLEPLQDALPALILERTGGRVSGPR